MARAQSVVERPEGLEYEPDFVSEGEERRLLAHMEEIDFRELTMRSQTARRTVRHYGYDYGYESWQLVPADPLPSTLVWVRDRCAALAGVHPEELAQTPSSLPGRRTSWAARRAGPAALDPGHEEPALLDHVSDGAEPVPVERADVWLKSSPADLCGTHPPSGSWGALGRAEGARASVSALMRSDQSSCARSFSSTTSPPSGLTRFALASTGRSNAPSRTRPA